MAIHRFQSKGGKYGSQTHCCFVVQCGKDRASAESRGPERSDQVEARRSRRQCQAVQRDPRPLPRPHRPHTPQERPCHILRAQTGNYLPLYTAPSVPALTTHTLRKSELVTYRNQLIKPIVGHTSARTAKS